MIKSVTKIQENKIQKYREKWKKIALSGINGNRKIAEEGINESYELAGLKHPKHFIWFKNPKDMFLTIYMTQLAANKQYYRLDSIRRKIWGYAFLKADEILKKTVKDSFKYAVCKSILDSKIKNARDVTVAALTEELDLEIHERMGSSDTYKIESLICNSIGATFEGLWIAAPDYFSEVFNIKELKKTISGLVKSAENSSFWYPTEEVCFVSDTPSIVHTNKQDFIHHDDFGAVIYPGAFSFHATHGVLIPKKLLL